MTTIRLAVSFAASVILLAPSGSKAQTTQSIDMTTLIRAYLSNSTGYVNGEIGPGYSQHATTNQLKITGSDLSVELNSFAVSPTAITGDFTATVQSSVTNLGGTNFLSDTAGGYTELGTYSSAGPFDQLQLWFFGYPGHDRWPHSRATTNNRAIVRFRRCHDRVGPDWRTVDANIQRFRSCRGWSRQCRRFRLWRAGAILLRDVQEPRSNHLRACGGERRQRRQRDRSRGLAGETVASVTGDVGQTSDFFSFYWQGGDFAAQVGVPFPNQVLPDQSVEFELCGGVGCQDVIETADADASDNWQSSLSGYLPAGYYTTGIILQGADDPEYSIDFTTPVIGGPVPATTSIPEPSTWVMLVIGFGGLSFAGRRLRRRQAPSVA